MKYFKFLYVKNHLLNSILIIWPLWEFESLVSCLSNSYLAHQIVLLYSDLALVIKILVSSFFNVRNIFNFCKKKTCRFSSQSSLNQGFLRVSSYL